MERDTFKSYKTFKLIQLILHIIFSISLFCFLYFDPSIKNNLYSNKSLLNICVFLWLFVIYAFAALINDFYQLEKNIVENHALSQTAYIDPLTNIPNHNSLDRFFDKYNNEDVSNVGCALITMANLVDINDTLGRDKGDKYLRDFSSIFEKVGDKFGFVGRNSGNEFIVVIDDCTIDTMQEFVNALSTEISAYNDGTIEEDIKISFQYVLNSEEGLGTFRELISRLYRGNK